jgi:hypothetical protein
LAYIPVVQSWLLLAAHTLPLTVTNSKGNWLQGQQVHTRAAVTELAPLDVSPVHACCSRDHQLFVIQQFNKLELFKIKWS